MSWSRFVRLLGDQIQRKVVAGGSAAGLADGPRFRIAKPGGKFEQVLLAVGRVSITGLFRCAPRRALEV